LTLSKVEITEVLSKKFDDLKQYIATQDDLDSIVQNSARLLRVADAEWLSVGRKPHPLCGAAVKIAAEAKKIDIKFEDLSVIFKCGIISLRDRVREMKALIINLCAPLPWAQEINEKNLTNYLDFSLQYIEALRALQRNAGPLQEYEEQQQQAQFVKTESPFSPSPSSSSSSTSLQQQQQQQLLQQQQAAAANRRRRLRVGAPEVITIDDDDDEAEEDNSNDDTIVDGSGGEDDNNSDNNNSSNNRNNKSTTSSTSSNTTIVDEDDKANVTMATTPISISASTPAMTPMVQTPLTVTSASTVPPPTTPFSAVTVKSKIEEESVFESNGSVAAAATTPHTVPTIDTTTSAATADDDVILLVEKKPQILDTLRRELQLYQKTNEIPANKRKDKLVSQQSMMKHRQIHVMKNMHDSAPPSFIKNRINRERRLLKIDQAKKRLSRMVGSKSSKASSGHSLDKEDFEIERLLLAGVDEQAIANGYAGGSIASLGSSSKPTLNTRQHDEELHDDDISNEELNMYLRSDDEVKLLSYIKSQLEKTGGKRGNEGETEGSAGNNSSDDDDDDDDSDEDNGEEGSNNNGKQKQLQAQRKQQQATKSKTSTPVSAATDDDDEFESACEFNDYLAMNAASSGSSSYLDEPLAKRHRM